MPFLLLTIINGEVANKTLPILKRKHLWIQFAFILRMMTTKCFFYLRCGTFVASSITNIFPIIFSFDSTPVSPIPEPSFSHIIQGQNRPIKGKPKSRITRMSRWKKPPVFFSKTICFNGVHTFITRLISSEGKQLKSPIKLLSYLFNIFQVLPDLALLLNVLVVLRLTFLKKLTYKSDSFLFHSSFFSFFSWKRQMWVNV